MSGKGSNRRPCFTGKEEEELRWQLYRREISRITFDKRMKELEKEGKIVRQRR